MRPWPGEHEFDQLCQALGIEHRLTKPKTPQTNGMVERFNRRLSQVMLPLLCGVLSSLLTRPFCAVPRTSVSRIA